ncbi:MAG: MFS transporter [Anaerolineales bacterium]|nr:MFS transporter [Anaerolineales bacterium]
MSLQESIIRRFPALGSRDFAIFWVGQFISLIGSWMQSTTQPYLAYRISGQPFDLGLIGFATTLPTFLLALPSGVLVERLDKRKTVIVLQTIMMFQALALAALTLSGQVQIWHLIVLSFLLGVANTIEITARQSMLIELVGKERLPNAIALQATIFNAARVLGPMVAAPFLVFVERNGEGWAFLANGLSYLFVVIGLLFVQTPFKEPRPSARQASALQEFIEGQRYIRSKPVVGMLILMSSIIGLIGFPLVQQIPVIARDVLGQAGDTQAAQGARNSLLFFFQGVGALSAALTLAAFNPRRKGWLLTAGQMAFSLSLIALSFNRLVPLAAVLILFVGWGTVTMLATTNTLIQLDVPNELRGRVFSTYLWGLQGVAPLGSLAIGWMSQHWGLPTALLLCGLACVAFIGSVHARHPEIRQRVA